MDEETKTNQPNLREKVLAAGVAIGDLVSEIGELPSAEITPGTAPFIGGLILARRLEQSYLDQQEPSEDERDDAEKIRLETGELKQTLTRAQQGNFSALAEFIRDETKGWEQIAAASGKKKQAVTATQINNMRLIAEMMPETGDGSAIKTQNPAWMEPPTPLKIQLQMMKPGGDVQI